MPEVEYSARNLSPTGRRSLTGVDYANNQNQWAEHNRIRQQEAMLALEQMRQRGENQRQGTFQDRTGFQSQQADLGRQHDLTLQGSFQDRSGAAMDMARMNPGYMRESRAQQEWESDAANRQIINDMKGAGLRQAAGMFGVPGPDGQTAAAGQGLPPEILQAIALTSIGGSALGSSVLQSKAQAEALAREDEQERKRMEMMIAERMLSGQNPTARSAGAQILGSRAGLDPSAFGGADVMGQALSGKTGLDDAAYGNQMATQIMQLPQVAQALQDIKEDISSNWFHMSEADLAQIQAKVNTILAEAQRMGATPDAIKGLEAELRREINQAHYNAQALKGASRSVGLSDLGYDVDKDLTYSLGQ